MDRTLGALDEEAADQAVSAGSTFVRYVDLVLHEFAAAAAGSAVAFFLLWYLHGAWQPGWSVLCGVVGGVGLRHLVAPTYATFPSYLRRPLHVGTVLLGTFLSTWGTLALYPLPYWILRWREVVALVAGTAFLGLALAAAVYTHARMRREVEEARAREAALREATLQAQLRALQAQINPHFLFNAFNVLAELTHDDPEVAERLVGDLAHLLRYSLRSSAVSTVSLEQEMRAVDRYLRVERARLGDRLRVETEVDAGALDVRIPGLVLQPLVENAVQHAVAPRPGGGTVRLGVDAGDHRVRISVEDDGPGIPGDVLRDVFREVDSATELVEDRGTGGAGGGLLNVRRRLALGYRGAAEFRIVPGRDGGTRVELEVPR